MQGLSIRLLGPDDAPAVVEIEKLCFPDPWSLKAVKECLEDREVYLFLGAFDGEKLAAYAGIQIAFDEGNILNVATHPAYRRRGAAKNLLREIIGVCDEDGVIYYNLEVRVSNEPAKALYKMLGFKEMGLRKGYYSDGEDAILMLLGPEPS